MIMRINGIFLIIVIFLVGCKVGPDHVSPKAPVLESFTQINPAKGVHLQIGADLTDWWTQLEDPILHELMYQAILCNPSLREAGLRIQRSRANVGVTRSELFPQLSADGSYRLSKNAGSGKSFETWDLGTSMSWEIDVFGRLKRLSNAAIAEMEIEQELYSDTYIILLADVATYYVTARAYQRQIHIARENIKIRQRTLQQTVAKEKVGTTSQLDISQASGSLASVESELPSLEEGYRHTLNRIGVLLGLPPGSYVDELLSRPGPIPAAPEQIIVGVPADLLRRRPDIRSAEKQIIAQTELVGAAVADLYPTFTLVGDFGVTASTFSGLWNSKNIAAGVSPGFRWNILNFGRYRSNIRAQEFRQQELLSAYQQTVLLAAEEVDNALSTYVNEKDRRIKLAQAVQDYGRATQISEARYEDGTVDFQRVLDSQREKLTYETQLTICESDVILSVIRLYRALGGGWMTHGYPCPKPQSVSESAPTQQPVLAPQTPPPAPAKLFPAPPLPSATTDRSSLSGGHVILTG